MLTHAHYVCPGSQDNAAALELAGDGVEYDGKHPDHQATYGIALYRNGKYDAALDALHRAADLRVEDNPVDLLFLAMASFESGDRRKARAYYERGVARLQATFPLQPLHRRIADEAARVLGIDPS